MDESNRRIVILGKTGAGKSSVANTIFGEELFKINDTAKSGTSKCQAKTRSVNGRSITLIDTPGFFDTDQSEEELKSEIIRCIIECAPGPHAFLIVLKVDKFTEQEQAVITKISQYFSEEIFKYATVLFTHGDQLRKGQTVEEFVHDNQNAIDLLEKCGERCHVIDNKYWKDNQKDEYRNNQFQVKELLKTIDKMVKANKGSCCTNEMLQAVEEDIQQEVEELIRQSSGTLTQEEVRKQAKDRVFNKLNIKLAGIATGVLLGALFGTVTMVGQVILMLTEKLSEPGQIKSLAYRAEAAGVIGAVGGTAVVGGAAAVLGGAVAGAAALGVIAALVAVAGAVKGGVAGYHAAEGADSPREAVQRATKAARDQAVSVFERLCSKDETEYEPLISDESKKGN
ncbi:GTPase IMAP family member 7-like [Trematomus bernacchii]|uniref:GTPase IMAP family member 7-like n=1 Tax=Trematomus bernacchii TaxID=40690 RepID=UPI00146CE6DA|nr:GTPase IMAP family member 7-like [Trematomus bernacchii]